MEIPVQINGKMRGIMNVHKEISEQELRDMICIDTKLKLYLDGKNIVKFIYVQNKIANIIVK